MEKKSVILLVDDNEPVRSGLGELLRVSGYVVIEASNAREGLELYKRGGCDIVVSDINMPEMTGIDLLKQIRCKSITDPVILITGFAELKYALGAVKKGAFDLLLKPVDLQDLLFTLTKAERYLELLRTEAEYKTLLESTVSEQSKLLIEANLDLKMANSETISRIVSVAEYRDTDTGQHIIRIGKYSATLATLAGLPMEEVEIIGQASMMHDIGKVGIPDSILLKQGALTPDEFKIIKNHTEIGFKMLEKSTSPVLKTAAKIALSHHEKWSGKGYPKGLHGDQIPLESRFVMLADQYDALRSFRPYKKELDHNQVFKIITTGDGRTTPEDFDPDVLNLFKKHHSEMAQIYSDYKGDA